MGRAIVRQPAVFLFDEPLSNLDAKLRVQIRAKLQALHRRLGTTTLYVTHNQVEAMPLAQRMLVMNQGRTEQIGAPLEVYTRPATTFVAGFIGSPPMNLIPGRIEADGNALATEAGELVRLPRAMVALAGRDVLLGVRPLSILRPAIRPRRCSCHKSISWSCWARTRWFTATWAPTNGACVWRHGSMPPPRNAHIGALPLYFEAQHMHLFDPASGQRLES
jgi:ABC-type sugar transport system ATPase subunit